jgi:hypothetical protein
MATNTNYVTDNKIGVNLETIYAQASAGSTALYPATPGEQVMANNNGRFVFAKAESTVAQYDCVIFSTFGTSASSTPEFSAVPITTTNAAALGWNMIGFAQVAVTSGYYGWFMINGFPRVNVLASCNPKVPLYTTATAGKLDDTTVSAGLIQGLVANTSAASASAPFCIASYPHLQIVGAG